MTVRCPRDVAIDEALAGLASMDVSPRRVEAVRERMHHQLARKFRRQTGQGASTRLSFGIVSRPVVVAALVVLYLAGVVRQALDFYGR